jgi:predicted GTPase
MGPTCAGKSTLINRLLSLTPKVGAVQIGKLMRAKYGEAHFQGQAAPAHTQTEALQMYFDETNRLVSEGKELILIDGQPRDVEQARTMANAWPQHNVQYLLITADHDVREERAKKDREPGPNLDLAIARLINDYKSNYLVMCELIKQNIPITVVDTSEEGFDLDHYCNLMLKVFNAE